MVIRNILSLYSQNKNTMTHQQIISAVSNKFEREFDANETMKVLTHNLMTYLSWGVSKKFNISNKGLMLKVSGHHHKGWVLITLAWDDTYSVYIVSNKGEIKDEYKNVFFDELTELIDDRIERIEEYVR